MIERKKKTCKSCGEEKYLYARGMCPPCDKKVNPQKHGLLKPSGETSPERAQIHKKRKRIAPVAAKRAKQLAEYRPKRDRFMEEHPVCMTPGCSKPSTELHHKIGREGKRLLMEEHWAALCSSCHRKYTDDSKTAIEIGVSKSRLVRLEGLK